jgi:hypothetical protein
MSLPPRADPTTNCGHFAMFPTLRVPLPCSAALQENGVGYVLWSMHSSQHELKHALTAIRPCAVQPICGKLSGSLAQLANSGDRAAAMALLDAYGAQAAARQAAHTAASDQQAAGAAAADLAVLPTDRSASRAAAQPRCSGSAPQQHISAHSPAAPEQKALHMPWPADMLHAAAISSRQTANSPAVRMSAASCTAIVASDLSTTASDSRNSTDSNRQQHCTAAALSCTRMQPADPSRHCSTTAVGGSNKHGAAGRSAHVPALAASPCKPAIPATAAGKENAWPSLPQKRAAPTAEGSDVQRPVRQAIAVAIPDSSRCEHALPTRREPTVNNVDSTTMSDAYINLDCLD